MAKLVKILSLIFVFGSVCAFSVGAQQEAQVTKEETYKVVMADEKKVVQEVSSLENEMIGNIDWENQVVYAVGDGVPPENAVNPAQARVRAKRAAIDEAFARLLEMTKEVRVDAESSTRDFVNENRVVETRVSGMVKNAEITEMNQASDGSYQVKMKMPLNGAQGLGAALLPAQMGKVTRVQVVSRTVSPSLKQEDTGEAPVLPETKALPVPPASPETKTLPEPPALPETKPLPETKVPASKTDILQVAAESQKKSEPETAPVQAYTGLIVDAKGLKAEPALYPSIKTSSGKTVYNLSTADPNATIEEGLCGYLKSLDDAKKNPRIGDNPLVIKAVGMDGTHKVDLVVGNEEGEAVLKAAAGSAFLKEARVMVVIDG